MTQAPETPTVETQDTNKVCDIYSSHSSSVCYVLVQLYLLRKPYHAFQHLGVSTNRLAHAFNMQSVDQQGKKVMFQF